MNLPGGTEENHENLSQDSRSPGRDLNQEHPEYKAGVLPTQPRRSAIHMEMVMKTATEFSQNGW
jgi:hypothetical protein